jgi:hypothetical protein
MIWRNPREELRATAAGELRLAQLLLPSALLMAVLTQLLAALVLVDFRFPTFFQ